MRLTSEQVAAIKQTARTVLEADAHATLFGSTPPAPVLAMAKQTGIAL